MARPFPIHNITDDSALGGSVIERSFRFAGASNTHLARTPSAGNRKIFTISAWVKRANLGTSCMFNAYDGSSSRRFQVSFNNVNQLNYNQGGTASSGLAVSNAKFRDTNAWYHFVFRAKYTNASASDRFKVYVNGSEISLSISDDVENADGQWNGNWEHEIGAIGSTGDTFDGYMTEIHHIDGEALLPTDFGYTDFQTGIWRPKRYEGTYGTNGFYLNFSNNSSISNMCLDKSGNGNNFSPDNSNTEDSSLDTPSNTFATLNSLILSPDVVFKEGNLYFDTPDTHKSTYCNFGVHTGKWYWEGKAIGGSTTKWTYGVSDMRNCVGRQRSGQNYLLGHTSGDSALTYAHGDVVSIYSTHIYKNGSITNSSYQTNPAIGNIIGIALDVDAGKIWFARNGTWINGSASASTTLNESSHDTTVATGRVYTPAFSGESADWQVNFGQDSSFSGTSTAQGNKDGNKQGDFYYAVPSGFKALCSNNLPITTPPPINPQRHFDTLLYTGNDGTNAITGLNFAPDFVWIKSRTGTQWFQLFDTVRGVNRRLYSNQTSGESLNNPTLTSFDSNGFTLGDDDGGINGGSTNYVAWCWKAGGNSNTFNVDGVGYASASAAGITDGTVALTGASVNRKAGFSIVTYAGNNASSTTFGHGLSQAPEIYILKSRDNTEEWRVYYTVVDGTYDFMYLNTTNSVMHSGYALPTSTLINKADDNGENMVAYCWHSVPGYSKIGSYTGNGDADGPFVYTGFRPAFVMMKEHTDSSTNWVIYDNMRGANAYNSVNLNLYPNLANAEGNASLNYDFVNNGFKIRTSNGGINANSDKYLYMAFAEQPGDTPYQTEPNAR